jgi:hypothetical protein
MASIQCVKPSVTHTAMMGVINCELTNDFSLGHKGFGYR